MPEVPTERRTASQDFIISYEWQCTNYSTGTVCRKRDYAVYDMASTAKFVPSLKVHVKGALISVVDH